MKKNRHQYYTVSYDMMIMGAYILLCLIGLALMGDIITSQNELQPLTRHIIYLTVSFICMIIILNFRDLEKIKPFITWMMGLSIALLILVLFVGKEIKGGKRSINLYFFSVQPSFFARLVLVLYYASQLSAKHQALAKSNLKELWDEFYALIIYTAIVFGLIALERHLSTLIISGATLLGMLTFAGIRMKYVVSVAVIGVILIFVTITLGAKFRSSRIETYKSYFLLTRDQNPQTLKSDDYQVKESITAMIRGGWTGTGSGKGLAKHSYLPESRTDYVFTIIGEQYGFLGALIVFGLHCLIFFRSMRIARDQQNLFLSYVVVGLALNLFLNVLVNTGVTMSILPATGTTLPFISFGGTALLMDSLAIGMILSIGAKRREL